MLRKAYDTSTITTMQTTDLYAGNTYNSENNLLDFIINSNPDPQNSSTPPRPNPDGLAQILPNTRVAKNGKGEWTITYTCGTLSYTNGRIEVVIPTGWTAPQITNNNAAGYVYVTSDGNIGTVTISGQTIQIPITSLLSGQKVYINYGYTANGVNRNALAQAPNAVNSYQFLV
ncbi:MAG TPA: hypothetical protein PLJ38_11955, partial [bacterium]|nr:hypothetical protein [bacterium]